jgi:hypothetical protein
MRQTMYGDSMGLAAEEAKVAATGILSVTLVSVATYVLSRLFPASPALYFFLWAFILVPLVVMAIGALAARAAYFACLGPNKSIALSVTVALVAAIAGIGLWLLAGTRVVSPDYVSEFMRSVDSGNYFELVPLLIVYALAGAIGGVYDYYISRGRKCEIRPRK